MLAQILAACVYVNSATIARDEKKNLHNLLTALSEKKKVDDKFAKSWNFCEYGFLYFDCFGTFKYKPSKIPHQT